MGEVRRTPLGVARVRGADGSDDPGPGAARWARSIQRRTASQKSGRRSRPGSPVDDRSGPPDVAMCVEFVLFVQNLGALVRATVASLSSANHRTMVISEADDSRAERSVGAPSLSIFFLLFLPRLCVTPMHL
ncbi:unnamed protein product [Ixodes pacificus]